MKNTYFFILFYNSLKSLKITKKNNDKGLYGFEIMRPNEKQTPEKKGDKQMQSGDHQIKHCKGIAHIRWMDNRPVLIVGCNVGNIGSGVSRREKGSATKKFIIFPNTTKMGEVDLMD